MLAADERPRQAETLAPPARRQGARIELQHVTADGFPDAQLGSNSIAQPSPTG